MYKVIVNNTETEFLDEDEANEYYASKYRLEEVKTLKLFKDNKLIAGKAKN